MTDPWVAPAEPEPKAKKWPRDLFAEAVWADATLSTVQKIVALAYADHARDGDQAWVELDRLMVRTGLSRGAISEAIQFLRGEPITKRGETRRGAVWLELVAAARRGRRSALYRLRIPVSLSSPGELSEASSSPGDERVHQVNAEGSPGGPHLKRYLNPSPQVSSPGELGDLIAWVAATEKTTETVATLVVTMAASDGETISPDARLRKDGRFRRHLVRQATQQISRDELAQERRETCGHPEHVRGGFDKIADPNGDPERMCPHCEALWPASLRVVPGAVAQHECTTEAAVGS